MAVRAGRSRAAQRWHPLLRLAVIGVIAALRSRRSPGCRSCCARPVTRCRDTGSAQHYLPADGAELTFPMLQFSLLGALCMLGTLWLVVRARVVGAGRRPGHRRARRLPVVAAVDADHAGWAPRCCRSGCSRR